MELRTPYFQVKMGDRDVARGGVDITAWVSNVTVVEDDRQADNVTITIPDPRMIYADALYEGSFVEVDLGYAESAFAFAWVKGENDLAVDRKGVAPPGWGDVNDRPGEGHLSR